MNGMPCGLYTVWDEVNQIAKCMAAIPVASGSTAEGLEALTMGEKAIMLDYYGAYDKIGDAHIAMEEYMKWHGSLMNGPAIEEYMNDPTTAADASETHTRIYYPIQ
jgi:effector-binding domain-containing protein